ncbi:hypothetical protein MP870_05590, partial [Escherichia coli]|nr:hypothetical protein [Escherichia coli]MCW9993869.1 hypothetical protein [Escherichia coli]
MTWFDGVDARCDMQMIIIIILRVLSGDPTGYGAATSRVFAIYENFPGKIMSVLLEHNYLFFLI